MKSTFMQECYDKYVTEEIKERIMNEQQPQTDIQWRRGRKKGTMILAEIKAPECYTIYRVLLRNSDKRSYCELPTYKDIPNSYIRRYAIIKE